MVRAVRFRIGLSMLALLLGLAACGRHAAHDEPPAPLDPSTIYPLVVRASDLPTGPVRRPLVDGLVVTLAAAQPSAAGQMGRAPTATEQTPSGQAEQPAGLPGAGQAKLLREPDLQGLSLDAAYTTALGNLEAAAKRGEIPVRAEMQNGRAVDIVWGHDWRAAACLLLPGARQQALATLAGPTLAPSGGSAGMPSGGSAGAPSAGSAGEPSTRSATIYAVIPNRDALVFFTDPAVGKAALAAEVHAPQALTNQVLRVLPGDKPFWIEAPVTWAQ